MGVGLCAIDMYERNGKNRNANNTAADPQAAAAQSETVQVNAPAGVPAKAGCLHKGLYNNAEKTELRHAEGCQSAPNQRFRGD